MNKLVLISIFLVIASFADLSESKSLKRNVSKREELEDFLANGQDLENALEELEEACEGHEEECKEFFEEACSEEVIESIEDEDEKLGLIFLCAIVAEHAPHGDKKKRSVSKREELEDLVNSAQNFEAGLEELRESCVGYEEECAAFFAEQCSESAIEAVEDENERFGLMFLCSIVNGPEY